MKSAMSKRLPGSMQPIRYALPFFLSVLSFAMANPASAQEDSMHNTLTVTGKGSEMVATSLTQAQLGVEVQGDTAEAAQREAAKRSSAVVEFLRSRQVDKLETTGINLSPRYNYNNDQQQLVGYTATNTVSFRVPTDQAGTILDEAVKAGATRIDGVNFIAEDAAIATARQQAIREAIQDAQLQADAALNALGLSRKGVVSVQIGGAAPPPPIMYRARALQAADAAPAPTPVVGGEQEVEASVTLEISY